MVRNGDFVRAYRKGKSFVHPQIVLYVVKNRAKKTRVGITASKKIGNAVARNRARRVIRHGLYQVLPEDIGSYDLVFVARGQTVFAKSSQLAPIIKNLLIKADLPISEDMQNEKNSNRDIKRI